MRFEQTDVEEVKARKPKKKQLIKYEDPFSVKSSTIGSDIDVEIPNMSAMAFNQREKFVRR